jgi:hypothetical protein
MNAADFRQRADLARAVPLETVLAFRGAARDRHDQSKWHTEQGPLSVTGCKFTNWQQSHGGGGAIDLVMHLAQVDCGTAIQWLEQHLVNNQLAVSHPASPPAKSSALQLPVPDIHQLDRIRQYLTGRRHLSASLIESLIQAGKLYADSRGNAVFLMVTGKPNRPIGAELRGTGPRAWRGMASGSRKDAGYFWIGATGTQEIILCESAIDAISCYQRHPHRICISTAGVRSNPRWLSRLLSHGYKIHCGFDADAPGDAAANRMIALHPAVQRQRPPAHDWNDALTASH